MRDDVGTSWDREYDAGLYVGCGNGRNMLAMLRAGLQLDGLDVSPRAIEQLRRRIMATPALRFAPSLTSADFLEATDLGLYDYMVALQVFQHGTESTVHDYFARARSLLDASGILFLRVNSVSTEIVLAHDIIEAGTSWRQFELIAAAKQRGEVA